MTLFSFLLIFSNVNALSIDTALIAEYKYNDNL